VRCAHHVKGRQVRAVAAGRVARQLARDCCTAAASWLACEWVSKQRRLLLCCRAGSARCCTRATAACSRRSGCCRCRCRCCIAALCGGGREQQVRAVAQADAKVAAQLL
jgi:hypothetical protein